MLGKFSCLLYYFCLLSNLSQTQPVAKHYVSKTLSGSCEPDCDGSLLNPYPNFYLALKGIHSDLSLDAHEIIFLDREVFMDKVEYESYFGPYNPVGIFPANPLISNSVKSLRISSAPQTQEIYSNLYIDFFVSQLILGNEFIIENLVIIYSCVKQTYSPYSALIQIQASEFEAEPISERITVIVRNITLSVGETNKSLQHLGFIAVLEGLGETLVNITLENVVFNNINFPNGIVSNEFHSFVSIKAMGSIFNNCKANDLDLQTPSFIFSFKMPTVLVIINSTLQKNEKLIKCTLECSIIVMNCKFIHSYISSPLFLIGANSFVTISNTVFDDTHIMWIDDKTNYVIRSFFQFDLENFIMLVRLVIKGTHYISEKLVSSTKEMSFFFFSAYNTIFIQDFTILNSTRCLNLSHTVFYLDMFNLLIGSKINGDIYMNFSQNNISSNYLSFFLHSISFNTLLLENGRIFNNIGSIFELEILNTVRITNFSCLNINSQSGAFLFGKSLNDILVSKLSIKNSRALTKGGSFYLEFQNTVIVKEGNFFNQKAGSRGGVFYFDTLNNVFIYNCNAYNVEAVKWTGGFLHGENENAISIILLSVIQGFCGERGGGICLNMANIMNIQYAVFYNCSANIIGGGGLYFFQSGFVNAFKISLIKCTSYQGGGIQVNAQIKFVMRSSFILECNTSLYLGGGIFVNHRNFILLEDIFFEKCNGFQNGGGIAVTNANDLFISKCIFKSLTSVVSNGGGLSLFSLNTCSIDVVLFIKLNSLRDGAGIELGDFNILTVSHTYFTNLISKNSSGAALFGRSSNTIKFFRTIFFNLTSHGKGGSIILISSNKMAMNNTLISSSVSLTSSGGLLFLYQANDFILLNFTLVYMMSEKYGLVAGLEEGNNLIMKGGTLVNVISKTNFYMDSNNFIMIKQVSFKVYSVIAKQRSAWINGLFRSTIFLLSNEFSRFRHLESIVSSYEAQVLTLRNCIFQEIVNLTSLIIMEGMDVYSRPSVVIITMNSFNYPEVTSKYFSLSLVDTLFDKNSFKYMDPLVPIFHISRANLVSISFLKLKFVYKVYRDIDFTLINMENPAFFVFKIENSDKAFVRNITTHFLDHKTQIIPTIFYLYAINSFQVEKCWLLNSRFPRKDFNRSDTVSVENSTIFQVIQPRPSIKHLFIIDSCRFIGNKGAVVIFYNQARIRISNSRFLYNRDLYGACITMLVTSKVYPKNPEINISYCLFKSNKAGVGGVLFTNYFTEHQKQVFLNTNQFLRNKAHFYGNLAGSFVKRIFVDTIISGEYNYTTDLSIKQEFLWINPYTKSISIKMKSGNPVDNCGLIVFGTDIFNQICLDNLQLMKFDFPTLIKSKSIALNYESYFGFPCLKSTDNILIDVLPDRFLNVTSEFSASSFRDIFTNALLNITNHPEVLITFVACSVGEQFDTSIDRCIPCKVGYSGIKILGTPICERCLDSDLYDCFGGDQIAPKPGYWRSSYKSLNFLPCPNPAACTGDPLFNQFSLVNFLKTTNAMYSGGCSKGYNGILCGECDEEYGYSWQFVCTSCKNPFIFVKFFLKLFIKVFFYYLSISRALKIHNFIIKQDSVQVNSDKKILDNLHVSYLLKILLNHFQILWLFFNFPFRIPSNFFDFIQMIFSAASPDINDGISVDCILSVMNMKEYKFTFILMFNLIFNIFTVTLFLLYEFYLLKTSNPERKPIKTLFILAVKKNFERIWLLVVLINFIDQLRPSMSTIACLQVGDPEKGDFIIVMVEDIGTYCETPRHLAWRNRMGIPFGLFKGILLPLYLLFRLVTLKRKGKLEQYTEIYGYFFRPYREGCYFYEIIVILRKAITLFFLLFVFSLINVRKTLQPINSMFLLGLFLYLCYYIHVRYKPYNNTYFSLIYRIERMSYLLLLLSTVLITVWLGNQEGGSLYYSIFLLGLCCVINIYFLVVWIFHFYKYYKIFVKIFFMGIITRLLRCFGINRTPTFYDSKHKIRILQNDSREVLANQSPEHTPGSKVLIRLEELEEKYRLLFQKYQSTEQRLEQVSILLSLYREENKLLKKSLNLEPTRQTCLSPLKNPKKVEKLNTANSMTDSKDEFLITFESIVEEDQFQQKESRLEADAFKIKNKWESENPSSCDDFKLLGTIKTLEGNGPKDYYLRLIVQLNSNKEQLIKNITLEQNDTGVAVLLSQHDLIGTRANKNEKIQIFIAFRYMGALPPLQMELHFSIWTESNTNEFSLPITGNDFIDILYDCTLDGENMEEILVEMKLPKAILNVTPENKSLTASDPRFFNLQSTGYLSLKSENKFFKYKLKEVKDFIVYELKYAINEESSDLVQNLKALLKSFLVYAHSDSLFRLQSHTTFL